MNQKQVQNQSQDVAESRGVRICPETKKRAEILLKEANKKSRGRKIKMTDLLGLALELVTDKDIQRLQRSSWTKYDEMEAWRTVYTEKRGQISRDDFLGFMMTNEWPSFMKEHKKEFESYQ